MLGNFMKKRKRVLVRVSAIALFLGFSPQLSFAWNGYCPQPGYLVHNPPQTYMITVPNHGPKTHVPPCGSAFTTYTPLSSCVFDHTVSTFCEVQSITVNNLLTIYSTESTTSTADSIVRVCTSLPPLKLPTPITVSPCNTIGAIGP
jgi:hypothetical protein